MEEFLNALNFPFPGLDQDIYFKTFSVGITYSGLLKFLLFLFAVNSLFLIKDLPVYFPKTSNLPAYLNIMLVKCVLYSLFQKEYCVSIFGVNLNKGW